MFILHYLYLFYIVLFFDLVIDNDLLKVFFLLPHKRTKNTNLNRNYLRKIDF